MNPMEAIEKVPARKKCPPRAGTVANEIRRHVRSLEKQIADAKREAKQKHAAGVILLDYLKSIGEGKTVNTTAMRRIRGAAAEFISYEPPMQLYECEKCGHRNYVTTADLEGERAQLGDAATRRLGELGKPKRPFRSILAAVLRRQFFTK